MRWAGSTPTRQDLSPTACQPCTGTVHLPGPITRQTEQAEWVRWQQKLQRQQVQVGPLSETARPTAALAWQH